LLVSSRLIEYELWNRLHVSRRHMGRSRETCSAGSRWSSLLPTVLARSREAFPRPVRTLDAMHLATVEYLRNARQSISLATSDHPMASAARALGIQLVAL
jgi:hypothetical protein